MNEIRYELIRSDRKTLGLQVKDGKVIVRAPWFTPMSEIRAFVSGHAEWIEKHLAKSREVSDVPALTEEELRALAKSAKELIPSRVRYWAGRIGVTYGRITIRAQRTRWGSCSSQGNLNFNCLLMLAPREALDSVIVHELCHRKEMNHSKRFYAEVYKVFPEYDVWHNWLKEHGKELMGRLSQ